MPEATLTEDYLLSELKKGSRTALARVLSQVENKNEFAAHILKDISARTGHALRIGITGPPGAGKSSLATSYVKLLRKENARVAVIAVDPTSPFSGGALLGDRYRMNALGLDDGVFVRSLATRGDLGGLAHAAGDMADVFDACGYDYILFETVGVGQSELEIVEYADTVLVVLVPESGDAIQGMKAGLMEIADIFVVNKSDREGAERFTADLQSAMHLKHWSAWMPPTVQTVATQEKGMDELHQQILRHINYLKDHGTFDERRRERTRKRIEHIVESHVLADFWTPARVEEMKEAIRNDVSPYEISRKLLNSGSC